MSLPKNKINKPPNAASAVYLQTESMASADGADLSFFSEYDPAIARLVQMREVARVLGSEIVSEMEFNRELNLAFMSHADPIVAQSVVEHGVVRPRGASLYLLNLYWCTYFSLFFFLQACFQLRLRQIDSLSSWKTDVRMMLMTRSTIRLMTNFLWTALWQSARERCVCCVKNYFVPELNYPSLPQVNDLLVSPLTIRTPLAVDDTTPEEWAPSKEWNTTEELLLDLPAPLLGANVLMDDDILFAQLHAGTLFAEWDEDLETSEHALKRLKQVNTRIAII
jgi:hypothetical protein